MRNIIVMLTATILCLSFNSFAQKGFKGGFEKDKMQRAGVKTEPGKSFSELYRLILFGDKDKNLGKKANPLVEAQIVKANEVIKDLTGVQKSGGYKFTFDGDFKETLDKLHTINREDVLKDPKLDSLIRKLPYAINAIQGLLEMAKTLKESNPIAAKEVLDIATALGRVTSYYTTPMLASKSVNPNIMAIIDFVIRLPKDAFTGSNAKTNLENLKQEILKNVVLDVKTIDEIINCL